MTREEAERSRLETVRFANRMIAGSIVGVVLGIVAIWTSFEGWVSFLRSLVIGYAVFTALSVALWARSGSFAAVPPSRAREIQVKTRPDSNIAACHGCRRNPCSVNSSLTSAG
ncbi:MAG: hypothetical protein U0992_01725 [Planctomycetaceae bacterium]